MMEETGGSVNANKGKGETNSILPRILRQHTSILRPRTLTYRVLLSAFVYLLRCSSKLRGNGLGRCH